MGDVISTNLDEGKREMITGKNAFVLLLKGKKVICCTIELAYFKQGLFKAKRDGFS